MTPQNFSKFYQQLNPQQKKAVDTIDGPVLVLAGPGTGKTQILALRIANILRLTDTDPRSILALTFTESAAKNMRERLMTMIGKAAYYVQINTFHGFCSEVIRVNPEFFPMDSESQAISELERFELIEKLLTTTQLDLLKPLNVPNFYVKSVITAISNLKREGLGDLEFEQILQAEAELLEQEHDKLKKTIIYKRERELKKNQELLVLFRAYQQELKNRKRFDFEDMINLVYQAFKQNEMLLRDYQENLLYFLIDEFQDTNNAQQKVINLLAQYWGDKANIFAVGDPNQAIYRFQGASIENVYNFISTYPHTCLIKLDQGYRCPQNLYDSSHALITHNSLILEKDELSKRDLAFKTSLKSTNQSKTCLQLFKAPNQSVETFFVYQEINKLLEKGVAPNEIAVLYRNHADALELIAVLNKAGLNFNLEGGENILEDEFIGQILTLFTCLYELRHAQEDEKFFKLLNFEFIDLSPLLVLKIARLAGNLQLSIVTTIHKVATYFKTQDQTVIDDKLKNAIIDSGLEITECQILEVFLQQLTKLSCLDSSLTFTEFFEKVLEEMQVFNYILKNPNKAEMILKLNSLYKEIKALVASQKNFKLLDFLAAINLLLEHNIAIYSEDLDLKGKVITLSTVHKAKGQEWDNVFIIRFVDKKWGNKVNRELIKLPLGLIKNTDLSKKERDEDDRRLFYVALTRAKKQIYLSYPELILENEQKKELLPSLFLKELPSEFIHQLEDPTLIKQSEDLTLQFMRPATKAKIKITEKDFYQKLVSNFSLNVTALNKYLKDPQEFIEDVLLRVPKAKSPVLVFGTAVHAALEYFYKQKNQFAEAPPLEKFLAKFQESLKEQVISPDELNKRLKYGEEILTIYYQQYQDLEVNSIFFERYFGAGFSKAMLGDISLKGRIDRIDILNLPNKEVRVIDYKTGKTKSSNFIEGQLKSQELSARERDLPESIRGPYKRQLLFYKLLCQLDKSFPFKVTTGAFEFVEPDKKSHKFTTRSFSLDDEAVNDLTVLIRQVMSEIRNLEFLANL